MVGVGLGLNSNLSGLTVCLVGYSHRLSLGLTLVNRDLSLSLRGVDRNRSSDYCLILGVEVLELFLFLKLGLCQRVFE